MKPKPILFTLAAALIFSCTRTNFYEHQLLTVLPASAHNRPIEVFFEDEAGPAKDYIEFYDLRVVRRGSFTDRQMVAFLKQEARKKGLDAITNMRTYDETEETATFMDVLATVTDPDGIEFTTNINYNIIEGKGIRYVENIDLTNSPKTGKIYRLKDNVYVGEIRYLPNGRIEETVAENDTTANFLDTYYKLSEDRLLHEQKNWQTLHHHDGRIDVRRKYRMNDWLLERVRVRYESQFRFRIRGIRLTENPGHDEQVTRINYKYNKAGQLVARSTAGAIAGFREKIIYENQRISKRTVQFAGTDYVIRMENYRQEDLKDLIKKAEVTE